MRRMSCSPSCAFLPMSIEPSISSELYVPTSAGSGGRENLSPGDPPQARFRQRHVNLGLLYVQMNRPEAAVPELQGGPRLAPHRTDAADALVAVWRGQARAAVSSGEQRRRYHC